MGPPNDGSELHRTRGRPRVGPNGRIPHAQAAIWDHPAKRPTSATDVPRAYSGSAVIRIGR